MINWKEQSESRDNDVLLWKKWTMIFKEKWKFEHEMPIQTKMIPEMLAGKDIVAESPTGSGKTLAYVLPLLHLVDGDKKQTQVLIMTPSQELSMQMSTSFGNGWMEHTLP